MQYSISLVQVYKRTAFQFTAASSSFSFASSVITTGTMLGTRTQFTTRTTATFLFACILLCSVGPSAAMCRRTIAWASSGYTETRLPVERKCGECAGANASKWIGATEEFTTKIAATFGFSYKVLEAKLGFAYYKGYSTSYTDICQRSSDQHGNNTATYLCVYYERYPVKRTGTVKITRPSGPRGKDCLTEYKRMEILTLRTADAGDCQLHDSLPRECFGRRR